MGLIPDDQENDEFDDAFFTFENYIWPNRTNLFDAFTSLTAIKSHDKMTQARETPVEKQLGFLEFFKYCDENKQGKRAYVYHQKSLISNIFIN